MEIGGTATWRWSYKQGWFSCFPISWHFGDTRFSVHLTPCSECWQENECIINSLTVSKASPGRKWANTTGSVRPTASSKQNQICPIHIGKWQIYNQKEKIATVCSLASWTWVQSPSRKLQLLLQSDVESSNDIKVPCAKYIIQYCFILTIQPASGKPQQEVLSLDLVVLRKQEGWWESYDIQACYMTPCIFTLGLRSFWVVSPTESHNLFSLLWT